MENEFGIFKTKFYYLLTQQQDWTSKQVVFLFENCQRKAEIEFSERWAQGASREAPQVTVKPVVRGCVEQVATKAPREG
jgi:hypothetical protein